MGRSQVYYFYYVAKKSINIYQRLYIINYVKSLLLIVNRYEFELVDGHPPKAFPLHHRFHSASASQDNQVSFRLATGHSRNPLARVCPSFAYLHR